MAEHSDDWHLVRIPSAVQLARRRGFPSERLDPDGMEAWCVRRCRRRWRVEPMRANGTVYRFEDRADAVAFALRWFPFKCG